jgi:hypothetical protein
MKRETLAIEAIKTAEKRIASLVSDAGQEREWDEASSLIDVGRRLRTLMDDLSKDSSQVNPDRISNSLSENSGSKTTSITRKARYPLFFRENEMLIKVAWSKSQRSEYEHKSPLKVLSVLIEVLLNAGSKGQRFSMDKILPLQDPDNAGTNLPDYQAYLCLAYLRHEGLIQQHGRSGYSIPKPIDFEKLSLVCWNRLASR